MFEEKIAPLHAESFFFVSNNGEFFQTLIYDYYDEEEYYRKLTHREKEFVREVDKLWSNMQSILDAGELYINGVHVRPRVIFMDIQHRGSGTLPYFIWIINFKGRFRRGVNIYRSVYGEEILEYDCEAYWCFPTGTKILDVKTYMNKDIYGNFMVLWARKGDKIGGEEEIRFRLNPTLI